MQKEKFILCPICGNKTRVQIREDTELKNFPLFCPKCHKQTLINAKQLNITKAEVPDAKTQSRYPSPYNGKVSYRLCFYSFSVWLSNAAFIVALIIFRERSSQL